MFNSKAKGGAVDFIYHKSEKHDKLKIDVSFSMNLLFWRNIRLFLWNLKNNPCNIEDIQVGFKYSDIIFKIPDKLGIEKWVNRTTFMAIKAMRKTDSNAKASIAYGEYVKWPGNTFCAFGSATLPEEKTLRHIMNDYEDKEGDIRGACVRLRSNLSEIELEGDKDILTVYKPLKPISKRGFITIEISKSFSSTEVIEKRIATALTLGHLLS